MGAIADAEMAPHIDTNRFERGHFFGERGQINHHAIPNDGLNAWAQDSAGDQLEDEFLFPDVNRVSGIVPALIAGDDVNALGQKIDNLPFSFVTPLGT